MEEQDNVYYVYLHRRGDNNEVFYVGKGKGVRATNKTGRNKCWKRVVEKHGFLVEIIESNLCEQNAFDLEIELIKFYRECGHTLCNMTNGGEGKSGTIVSAETRAKLSIARIGNPNCTGHRDSLETRAKKSKSRVGKKHSEETRRKIGQSNKKPIQCSNGMVFDGSMDAKEWLKSAGFEKASAGAVTACCRKERNIAYGFKWCFVEEPEENLLYVAVTRSQRVL